MNPPRPLTQAALLHRRCRCALAHHRRRARAVGATVPYGVAELEALARAAVTCAYCGMPVGFDWQFDHRTPIARGGAWTLDNLAVCCAACNSRKGILTVREYLNLLELLRGFHPAAAEDVLRRLRHGSRVFARRKGGG